MMGWLRKVLNHPPRSVPDATAHKATLARADRLLRLLEEYRAADARRRHG